MTYDVYEKIKSLQELLESGAITQEEFEQEKAKVLSAGKNDTVNEETTTPQRKNLFGLDENIYLLLMHLSQFVSTFIIPIIMWAIGKDDSERVNIHGKNIFNFVITYAIWGIVGIVTIPIVVGIIILSVIGIVVTVSIIIASIKAFNGEDWQYPLTIKFIK